MTRYHILNLVGAGGMGTVYQALDRLTNEHVALKRIEQINGLKINSATDRSILQNLAHEFSVLAGIRHPHIISVLDYGFDEEMRPYLAMEFVRDAQPITEAAQTAPFEKRVDLMAQLLQALDYLHRQGILHRDLKPANVLVSHGKVRLLDFGLAALGETRGEFAGTTACMPPEMLQEQQYVPASDLYSAGVLFAEMLTGQLPLPEGDVLAILNDPPDLIGLETTPVYDFLVQMLQKTPAARYPDATVALTELSRACDITTHNLSRVWESHLVTAPFVGREDEMAQLSEALQNTVDGQGTAILIGGESGVGKSRLLNEVRTSALTRGAYVLHGQALQEGSLPYQLWHEPLAHLAVTTTLTDTEAAIVKVLLPEKPWLIDQQTTPVPLLQKEAEQQRLAYTLVNLIYRLGRPVVLLLEDLQWAQESLDVLQRLVNTAPSLPLMIVGTFRTDAVFDVTEQFPSTTTLMLPRLSRQSVEALCNAVLGAKAKDQRLVKHLYQESEGNAFFLTEALHMLVEQAHTRTEIAADDLYNTLFSKGMAEVVRRRLEFAPAWAQPLLNLAAVAGRQIDPILLDTASGGAGNVDKWLYTCAQAKLLEAHGNQWRFAHDKLRDSLLAALAPDEKAELHRHIAEALEARHGADLAYAKQLSDHWFDAGNIDKALLYTQAAGEYLRRIGAFTELQTLAQRNLDLLRPTDDDRLRALLWEYMGDACLYNDMEAARAAYQKVLDLYERHNWDLSQTSALRGLSVIYRDQGDIDTAEQLTDRLLDQASQHENENQGLMSALSLKARFYLFRGEYKQAQLTYEQCLATARHQADDIQIAKQLMNLGAVACMQGQFDVGRRTFHEAEQIAEAVGAVDITIYCLLNEANLASDFMEYKVAESYFDRCIPMIESLGEYILLAGACYDYGDLMLRQGKFKAAHGWYEKSRNLAAQLQNSRKLSDCLHGLGKVAYLQRDYTSAERYIQSSQQHAVDLNLLPDQISNLHYLTNIYLNLGNQAAALDALQQGLRLAQKIESSLPQLEILTAAAFFFLFTERPQQAAEVWGTIRHHPETLPRSIEALQTVYAELEENLTPDELVNAVNHGRNQVLPQVIKKVLVTIKIMQHLT